MKANRLEEVLDECLSAYLDGRRTIEESLSLYPDIKTELEPLLRTAVELADAFRDPSPSPHVEERGRQEFLNSASVRRRARELTQDVNFSRRIARAASRRPQFPFIVAVVFLTFAAVAAAVLAFESSPREGELQAGFVPASAGPAISDLRQTQEQLRDQAVRGEGVSAATIRELAEMTRELEAQVEFGALDPRSRRELQLAISEQVLLLRLIAGSRPAAAAPDANQALDLTERIAEDLGVDLPGPVATPAGSPSATPTVESTRDATPSAAASASPSPTATPSLPDATPTPAPVSTAPDLP
jgi:hypothetical protein